MMEGKTKRVVIVGGGFGGLMTAFFTLRGCKDKNLEVVIVDKNTKHTYTPWLYAVATAQLDERKHSDAAKLRASAQLPFATIAKFADKRLRFRHEEVVAYDKDERNIVLASGKTMRFDVLVFALGSTVAYYGTDGAQKHCYAIQSVDGALQIREAVRDVFKKSMGRAPASIAIIGSGPTGIETTARLAQYLHDCEGRGMATCANCRIVMLTASKGVLDKMHPFLRSRVSANLKRLGVEVIDEAMVQKVSVDGLEYIKNGKTHKTKYDMMIWAAGMKPVPLIGELPFERTKQGRLVVERTFQVRGEKNIFALGDIVDYVDEAKGVPLPASAWVAVDEGKVVGRNIAALLCGGSMREYKAPKVWPASIATGGSTAVGVVGAFKTWGFPGFVFRRLIDVNYFVRILPLLFALKHWWQGSVVLQKNGK